MVKRIILLSGPIASGKSTLAKALVSHYALEIIQTRELLSERLARSGRLDRLDLQAEGDQLDLRTRGQWVRDELECCLQEMPRSASIIVDSVRKQSQINAIRETYGSIVWHIHLTAPVAILAKRYIDRARETCSRELHRQYEDVRINETEQLVDQLQESADLVIDSSLFGLEEILDLVASKRRMLADEYTK